MTFTGGALAAITVAIAAAGCGSAAAPKPRQLTACQIIDAGPVNSPVGPPALLDYAYTLQPALHRSRGGLHADISQALLMIGIAARDDSGLELVEQSITAMRRDCSPA